MRLLGLIGNRRFVNPAEMMRPAVSGRHSDAHPIPSDPWPCSTPPNEEVEFFVPPLA
jgi:hypothetical protein